MIYKSKKRHMKSGFSFPGVGLSERFMSTRRHWESRFRVLRLRSKSVRKRLSFKWLSSKTATLRFIIWLWNSNLIRLKFISLNTNFGYWATHFCATSKTFWSLENLFCRTFSTGSLMSCMCFTLLSWNNERELHSIHFGVYFLSSDVAFSIPTAHLSTLSTIHQKNKTKTYLFFFFFFFLFWVPQTRPACWKTVAM